MSYIDLQATLAEWPYDAEQISVRKILGTDGLVRIQMRVELGVLQMEAEGRPDGIRPHGWATLLEYHQKRLEKHQERSGSEDGFRISPRQCHELRVEASLYYRRYVALFVLEEYADVIRDTAHNLAVFDFCRAHAREADDRACLETFRPYVLMMNARARALQALEQSEPASALAHINRGIMHIRTHYEEAGTPEALETCEEMRMLRALAAELGEQKPRDPVAATRQALQTAIEKEQFEEASRLRDILKDMEEHPQ